jgi:hypothetical protein
MPDHSATNREKNKEREKKTAKVYERGNQSGAL